jgi:AcrR family transcriptional regulator
VSSHPANLRERNRLRAAASIFDAAVALLAERPYSEITVEEISERAEVGRATFFRIYGTKNGLLAELARRLAESARATLATTGETSAEHKLGVVEHVISETWTRSERGVREMAAEAIRAGIPRGGHDSHSDVITLIAEIIEEGQNAGEFRSTTLTPDVLGWMLVVSFGVCVMDWLEHPDQGPLRPRTREALDLLLAGLRRVR